MRHRLMVMRVAASMVVLSLSGKAAAQQWESQEYQSALDLLLPMQQREPGSVVQIDVRMRGGLFAERSISVSQDRMGVTTIRWRRPASGAIWTSLPKQKASEVRMLSGTVAGATCSAVALLLSEVRYTEVPVVPRASMAQDVETLDVRIQGMLADHRISYSPERDDTLFRWVVRLESAVAACDRAFLP